MRSWELDRFEPIDGSVNEIPADNKGGEKQNGQHMDIAFLIRLYQRGYHRKAKTNKYLFISTLQVKMTFAQDEERSKPFHFEKRNAPKQHGSEH
ncbi:hypothetical protein GCM10028827_09810 [Mucilaginibacter myungsuensis]